MDEEMSAAVTSENEPNETWNGIPESLSISGKTDPSTATTKTTERKHGASAKAREIRPRAPRIPEEMPSEMCERKLAIFFLLYSLLFYF
jgi:hypothetical protein